MRRREVELDRARQGLHAVACARRLQRLLCSRIDAQPVDLEPFGRKRTEEPLAEAREGDVEPEVLRVDGVGRVVELLWARFDGPAFEQVLQHLAALLPLVAGEEVRGAIEDAIEIGALREEQRAEIRSSLGLARAAVPLRPPATPMTGTGRGRAEPAALAPSPARGGLAREGHRRSGRRSSERGATGRRPESAARARLRRGVIGNQRRGCGGFGGTKRRVNVNGARRRVVGRNLPGSLLPGPWDAEAGHCFPDRGGSGRFGAQLLAVASSQGEARAWSGLGGCAVVPRSRSSAISELWRILLVV